MDSQGNITERKIHPYGLYTYYGSNYFIGKCEERYALRQFKLVRIKEIQLLKEKFEKDNFNLSDYLKNTIGIFKDKSYKVKLKITYPYAMGFKEYSWTEDEEIEDYIAQRQADMDSTGDNSIQFEITSLNQCLMLLEQRTQDLRTAESVAMQSIPMIKTMEFSNMNLVRKINSAFIITLPVFKQALAQAIMLKRQRIQAESMAALDAKTNEMLIKNARNTVEQSKITTRLASGSSIKIETLENTWRTIVNGIDETKAIQENARKQRVEDAKRLEVIKQEFNQRYHMPNKK